MRHIDEMKSILLYQDPTYPQEELDGMTEEQVCKAYRDYVDTLRYDPEDWDWRKAHVIQNNL